MLGVCRPRAARPREWIGNASRLICVDLEITSRLRFRRHGSVAARSPARRDVFAPRPR
jgi:hypothetical protein